ncbi:sensor histidine kinase [Nocardioides sp. GXZ039]|uniref:sensor histidine kinase n=1 Tax=Nocardioides sp. GXZ039 TaxID=3136018 RepID=UPI0030F3AFCF
MSRRSREAGSFRTQLVGLVCAVTLLGVIALTIVVQVVLDRSTNQSVDAVLDERATSVIGSATVVEEDGAPPTLQVPESRLEAGVAVYDEAGRLVAGFPPSSQSDIYTELATATTTTTRTQNGDDESRVLARPFTVDGVAGVVVVTERLAPYERAEAQALWVSIGAGILMVILAAVLALWVSRRTLAPVAEMTRAADDWSEHDLAHRFDLGDAHNEIAALGRTLDRLLDRVATAIRAEQRLTSELAHELRTPLTAIQANTDLMLMRDLPADVRESLDDVAVAARRMGATIESLLELARSASSQILGRSCVLADAVAEALAITVADDERRVEVDVDRDLRVLLPGSLAVRAISPILENGRRLAARVTVSAAPTDGYVRLLIDDDGPGIPVEDRELVFEPGRTGGAGSGLGLSLSRRVARSMGGDVTIEDGPLTTRLVVTLPRA